MFMSAASITPTKDVKNYCCIIIFCVQKQFVITCHNNAEVFLHVIIIISIQAKYKCGKSHGDS